MTNTQLKYAKLFPVMLCFFAMGFVDLVGIASNYVKEDLGLTDSEANIFPFFGILLVFDILSADWNTDEPDWKKKDCIAELGSDFLLFTTSYVWRQLWIDALLVLFIGNR